MEPRTGLSLCQPSPSAAATTACCAATAAEKLASVLGFSLEPSCMAFLRQLDLEPYFSPTCNINSSSCRSSCLSMQLPAGWPAPPPHIDKLPNDALQHILHKLDLEALIICSLVCQKWQEAFADVTSSGCTAVVDSLEDDITFSKWVQLACWLRKRSGIVKLRSLKVRVLGRLHWTRVSSDNPTADGSAAGSSSGPVHGVKVGTIQHSIMLLAAANPLAYVGSSLTSLHLTYCSVNLQQLAACSNLRSLKLHYTDLLGTPKYHSDQELLTTAGSSSSPGSSSPGGSSSSSSSSSSSVPGWLALPADVSAASDLLDRHPSVTATLNAALPALQQLTCLEVTGCISDAYRDDSTDGIVISSSLKHLRQLTLSTKVDQATFAELPSGLTKLNMDTRGHSVQGAVTVSTSSAPGLCKLSALKELVLTGVRFELGTLAGFKQLQKLVLREVELTGLGVSGSHTAVMRSLKQLQHLEVQFAKPAAAEADDANINPVPAAVADAALAAAAGIVAQVQSSSSTDLVVSLSAAVTASTQLTHLSLGQIPGPGLAQADLPQLQPSFVSTAFPVGHLLPQLVTFDAEPGLVISGADVSSIARCCPNLKTLRLKGAKVEGLGSHFITMHLPAQLKALQAAAPMLEPLRLSQLTGLTELRVEAFNMRGAARGLLPLKQLETLEVQLAVGECLWGYEKLTALTNLTDLTVRQYAPDIDMAVFGSKVRPCVFHEDLLVGTSHSLSGLQAAMCVSAKLPRALGLYDNSARVARFLRRGAEPWQLPAPAKLD